MIGITLEEIVKACGGRWQGPAESLSRIPEQVTYDSRQVTEGSLFVATKGEHTDGHRFIPDVLSRKALAILCEEAGPEGEQRIVVPSTMDAMRKIAVWNRDRMAIPFIGVTGSVGKTTAKEMICSVLSTRFQTFKTPGSMNGQLGIPAAFLSLTHEHQAAVVEMGVSLPGEMARLARIVRPDMAVFMNVGDAHLEALHDHAGILKEKSDILSASSFFAPMICNGDDPMLCFSAFDGRPVIRFGLEKQCDVRAVDIQTAENGTAQRCVIVSGERRIPVTIPAYGIYMVYAALAAASVGLSLGLTDDEIQAGIAAYKTVGHRSRLIKTGFGTLIDDCYNANPNSVRAAIRSMNQLEGRKVCILGDMLELGEHSDEIHRNLGTYAVQNGVELLLTAGEHARNISEGAGSISEHYPTKEELIRALPNKIKKGDTVLVKASHGARFEDITDILEKM